MTAIQASAVRVRRRLRGPGMGVMKTVARRFALDRQVDFGCAS
jgi:hypothetical protein